MLQRIPILAFLLVSCLSYGQARDDYDAYMQAAGDATLLFRGRSALPYNFPHNGTYYWYTPEFIEGTVRFNGKEYHGIELNIDAARQALICGISGSIKRSELERAQVECFTIGDRHFVNADGRWTGDAPEGYLEVLLDGPNTFLKQRVKTLVEDKEGTRSQDTDYSGVFKSSVWRVFVCQTDYYIKDAQGALHKVKKRKDVYRLFKDHRKQLRKYVSSFEKDNIIPFEQFGLIVLDRMNEQQ